MNATDNKVNLSLDPLQGPDPDLIRAVSKAAFGTSIYLIFAALTTVAGNSLLLLLFFKAPDRWFRQSSTYFLASVAFCNLITGLVAEPMQAACFMMLYLQDPNLVVCQALSVTWPLIHLVTMNISLFSVLAFTVAQYLAVISPLKLSSRITKRRVVLCEVFIWIYVGVFQLSYHMGVPYKIFYEIDIYFNTILMLAVTITLYVLLHKAFMRKMTRGLALRSVKSTGQVEKQFVIVNGFLIFLYIVCILPTTCISLASLYWPHLETKPEFHIAAFITDSILYLKFMLDPFVFAWRLPKYRDALVSIFRYRRSFGSPPRSRFPTATTDLSQKEIATVSSQKTSSPNNSSNNISTVIKSPRRKKGTPLLPPTKIWDLPVFSLALRSRPNKHPYRRQQTLSCSDTGEEMDKGIQVCACSSANVEPSGEQTTDFCQSEDMAAALLNDSTNEPTRPDFKSSFKEFQSKACNDERELIKDK